MRFNNLQEAMRAVRPVRPASAKPPRYKSEDHERWHRRVEGQIRDCMHMHPRWFKDIADTDRAYFTRSLAKRIVGEILADGPGSTVSLTPASVADGGGVRSTASWTGSLWRSIGGRGFLRCVRRFFRGAGLGTESRVR